MQLESSNGSGKPVMAKCCCWLQDFHCSIRVSCTIRSSSPARRYWSRHGWPSNGRHNHRSTELWDYQQHDKKVWKVHDELGKLWTVQWRWSLALLSQLWSIVSLPLDAEDERPRDGAISTVIEQSFGHWRTKHNFFTRDGQDAHIAHLNWFINDAKKIEAARTSSNKKLELMEKQVPVSYQG